MGRPRKEGERYPSGDLKPENDRGSEYALAQRVLRIAPERSGETVKELAASGAALSRLSTYQLGIYLETSLITESQFRAGQQYARLYKSIAPVRTEQSCLKNLVAGGGGGFFEDDSIEAAKHRKENRDTFFEAKQRMMVKGRAVVEAVEAVAIFDQRIAKHEHASLAVGLHALELFFDRRRKS